MLRPLRVEPRPLSAVPARVSQPELARLAATMAGAKLKTLTFSFEDLGFGGFTATVTKHEPPSRIPVTLAGGILAADACHAGRSSYSTACKGRL